jgi:hypothetical protein
MPDEDAVVEEEEGGGRWTVCVAFRSVAVGKSRLGRLRCRWIVAGAVGVGGEWRRSVWRVHWPVNLLEERRNQRAPRL